MSSLSKGPNRVRVSLSFSSHLKAETDQIFETFCFPVIYNSEGWTKFKNLVIVNIYLVFFAFTFKVTCLLESFEVPVIFFMASMLSYSRITSSA
jgi:hypothetical protein